MHLPLYVILHDFCLVVFGMAFGRTLARRRTDILDWILGLPCMLFLLFRYYAAHYSLDRVTLSRSSDWGMNIAIVMFLAYNIYGWWNDRKIRRLDGSADMGESKKDQ